MSKCSCILGIALAAVMPWQCAVAQPSNVNCGRIMCRVFIPFGSCSAASAAVYDKAYQGRFPTVLFAGEVRGWKGLKCGKRLSIVVIRSSPPKLHGQIEVDVVKCFYWNGKVGNVVSALVFETPDTDSSAYQPIACTH